MTEIELVCVGPDGATHPVVVRATPSHRIADLATALVTHLGAPSGQLYQGIVPVPGEMSVGAAGLVDGALLGVGQPLLTSGHGLTSGEVPEISVVGGLHGGPSRLLHPGAELRVGRGPDADLRVADPEMSRDHAQVSAAADGSVRLTDANSHNGIRWQGWRMTEPARLGLGDVAGLGETVLGLRPAVLSDADLTAEPGGGRLWFNRPPRISVPEAPDELLVPVEPDKPNGFRFPWLAVLLPLLFGGVLYLVLPNAGYFLLIMLLSPVMVLANVVGDRRSGRKDYKARKKEYDLALETFHGALGAAHAAEERRVRTVHPDPSWVVAAACAPSARLWERRPTDSDFLQLRLGLHSRPAELRLRFDPRSPQPRGGTAELPKVPVVCDVPATVELRRTGILGMAGERRCLLAAARAIVAQAAGLHAPRDLGIVVLTGPDECADWEWTTWLPHTKSSGTAFGSPRLIATDCGQAESRLTELRALVSERLAQQRSSLRAGRPTGRELLVVVDGARRMRGLPCLAELLAEGPAAGVYALCLDDDETALPAECGATVVLTNPSGSRARLRRNDLPVIEDLLVDGLQPGHAMRMALALAPLDALGAPAGVEALPKRVRFSELAGLAISGDAGTDEELIRQGWAVSPGGRSTTARLGVGASGPLTVDLRRDGPHALVAGTSGSGKSELLQTLIASLALSNMPDALTFVLVDYKGGSAFAACADLPHCVGLITDLDGHLVSRALDSLSAELRRREKLLADAQAKDIDDYWARTGARLPRLVIVVDEFASLIEEVPEFVPGVVGLGMRGRSLGVHVVLATQRPGGVVTADMRANLNLRICLRVTAETESVDVIDAPDAARITSRQPGRAYLRTGHSDLTAFQAARVGWPRTADAESAGPEPVWVRTRRITELGRAPSVEVAADVDTDGHTDLTALVAASRAAAHRLGLTSPPRPWLPPLPEVVTTVALAAGSRRKPLNVPLGLADRPSVQAQDLFEIDLEETGPVAVAGMVRTGRSTALRAIAAGLCAATGPDTVHLYGLDCGNRALAPLAGLPHTGAVVDAEDPVRVARLLDWLDGEVRRRQQVLAGEYSGLAEQRRIAAPVDRLPYLILLLDRLEGFRSAFDEYDGGRLVELLEGLLRRGPAVGLVTVLSTDRTAFGPRIATAVEHRLVLRQADRDDATVFGLSPRDLPAQMPAGRAIWTATGEEVQIALLDGDRSGAAQIRALSELAGRLRTDSEGLDSALLPHRIDPLPERICLAEAEALRGTARPPSATVCTPAVGGDHVGPLDVDLVDAGGTFLVAGPSRSGRSTALSTMVHGLAGRTDGRLPVVLVAPRPSPLRQLAGLSGVLGMTTGAEPAELEGLVYGANGPVAVIIDDGELVDELALGEALERFLLQSRDTGSVLVAAATTDDLLINRYRGWLAQARRARSGILLNPASHLAGEVFDVRLPRSIAGTWPPGRGLLVRRGDITLAQVPLPLADDLAASPGSCR